MTVLPPAPRPPSADLSIALIALIALGCVLGCSAPARPPSDAVTSPPAAGARTSAGDGARTSTDDAALLPPPEVDAAPPPTPQVDAGPAHREPRDAPKVDAAHDTEDAHAVERLARQFARGARARDPLSGLTAARRAITHVVVIMQENRSFDHLFGTLGHGTEGIPAGYSNRDASNVAIVPFALGPACAPDVPHGWAPMHAGWNSGAMDGWARTNGRQAMSHLVDADHPFYSWLATTFATADRYFASVLGPTHPNRAYLYGGTSDGLRESYAGYPRGPFVFDALDAAGVGWAAFNASPM